LTFSLLGIRELIVLPPNQFLTPSNRLAHPRQRKLKAPRYLHHPHPNLPHRPITKQTPPRHPLPLLPPPSISSLFNPIIPHTLKTTFSKSYPDEDSIFSGRKERISEILPVVPQEHRYSPHFKGCHPDLFSGWAFLSHSSSVKSMPKLGQA
jgi:hypothetical protein